MGKLEHAEQIEQRLSVACGAGSPRVLLPQSKRRPRIIRKAPIQPSRYRNLPQHAPGRQELSSLLIGSVFCLLWGGEDDNAMVTAILT